MAKFIHIYIFLFLCINLFAQKTNPSRRLSVFIDCNGISCDQNYIRTEINIVDYSIEPKSANIHVLITASATGGGTIQYQLIFYGQNNFKPHLDTLRFNTSINATKAEIRTQLTHFIKLGLIPFLAKTDYASSFSIQMKQNMSSPIVMSTRDPWNYFVLNLNAEGSISADQNYTNLSTTSSFSTNRTTEQTRFQLGAYGSKYIYTYKITNKNGVQKYEVKNSDYGIFHSYVLSITQHWSAGYIGNLTNTTFQNIKLKKYFNPVLEYNLFKYKEVNNRSFLIRYGIDFSSFKYYETTLYNKKKENLFGQELSVNVNFNQKWGSINSGAYYHTYFKDHSLYSTGAKVNLNIRVTGGLSFYVSCVGNIIHDQVYLLKGGATEQEILIRKRQLESSFDYYTSLGINIRFGSKLNNFVNTRISGYRGF